jgi:hypothetical protein
VKICHTYPVCRDKQEALALAHRFVLWVKSTAIDVDALIAVLLLPYDDV